MRALRVMPFSKLITSSARDKRASPSINALYYSPGVPASYYSPGFGWSKLTTGEVSEELYEEPTAERKPVSGTGVWPTSARINDKRKADALEKAEDACLAVPLPSTAPSIDYSSDAADAIGSNHSDKSSWSSEDEVPLVRRPRSATCDRLRKADALVPQPDIELPAKDSQSVIASAAGNYAADGTDDEAGNVLAAQQAYTNANRSNP